MIDLQRRFLVVLALLATFAVGAAACDDDDDDDDSATEVAIRGIDFGFDGVPETLSAGTHRITFANDGAEVHEVVIFKLPDGMTLEQALELPEEESDALFYEGVIGVLFARPGEQSAGTLIAELTSGNYGLLCFVENANGPHAFQGMLAQLGVE